MLILLKYMIIFTTLLTISAPTQAREIKLATTNWPPYFAEYLPEQGFFTVLVVAALDAVGHNTTITFLPWKRTLILTERGDYDGVMAAYFSEERDHVFRYSDPIYTDSVVLYARRDIGLTRYKHLRELVGYKIAVGRGWVYSPEFDAATYLNKDDATDQIINIRKLYLGRVDLLAASESVFRYEVNQHADFNLNDVVKLEPPLSENDLFMMFPKSLPDSELLTQQFNKGLQIIRDNGMFDQILNRFGMRSD